MSGSKMATDIDASNSAENLAHIIATSLQTWLQS